MLDFFQVYSEYRASLAFDLVSSRQKNVSLKMKAFFFLVLTIIIVLTGYWYVYLGIPNQLAQIASVWIFVPCMLVLLHGCLQNTDCLCLS